MSFTASSTGTTFEAGYFLVDDEQCLRLSATIATNHAQKVTRNGRVIVPAGAVIPANGATAKGILYEDIDVTDGDAFGSIVTKGVIYGDRLPAALDSDAATALTGIKVVTSSPAVTRPAIFGTFDTLTVASVAGTAVGDTKVTVSGYTLKSGESYVYKTHATVAPAVKLADDLSEWTALTNGSDITATTGHKITVAVKDANGEAVAAGSTDVTAKANG